MTKLMSHFEIFFEQHAHFPTLGTYYLSSNFFLSTHAVYAHSKSPINTFFKAIDTIIASQCITTPQQKASSKVLS